MSKARRLLWLAAVLITLVVPMLSWAGPRSGSSFSGRGGFRSAPVPSRGYSSPGRSGGGSGFIFLPSFGWGWGGYGLGGGGFLGTLMLVGVVGVGAALVVRAARRASRRGPDAAWSGEAEELAGQSYVYKVQLGLGRSGRGIQQRLTDFAEHGDTSSEQGLAELLQQTALELTREKDSIRYVLAEGSGPMSLTNGETKLNAAAMAERSRFQVERVRGAEGNVRRSEAQAVESAEVLEYLVVTVVIATRTAQDGIKQPTSREDLDRLLAQLGAVSARVLLGLDVVWTPADPGDSLTETDLMTTYPDLRSL